MKIKFSDDLSQQEIYAVGTELATVMGYDKDENGKRIYSHPDTQQELVTILNNPVLMTDRYKIMQIADYPKRIATEILQTKAERILEYDWFTMKWNNSNQYPGMWFPSIDTVFLCSCLQQEDFSSAKKIAEIWSWPGFIWKYIKYKHPTVESLLLNDINPSAQKYFEETNQDPQAKFLLQDGKELLNQEKFDFVFCNPPYVPRPKSIDDNPYEWLSLVIHMLTSIKSFLNQWGSLVLALPNLVDEILQPFMDEQEMKIEELWRKEVPLKVSNILMNKERLSYLTEQAWLKEEEKDGYKYRQTIKIIKFTPKQ